MPPRRHPNFRFFSQLGEDYLLWHFFDLRRTGFFLDIGAHDGVTASNTKFFEDQGWDGICVEPISAQFAECQRHRRRVVCAACVAGADTEVEMRTEESGLLSGVAPDETYAARIYEKLGKRAPEFRTLKVPALRAAALLQADDPPIDFASIDVEGTEIDVLKGLDLTKNRPRVLLIEANTAAEREKLDAFLALHGYFLGRSIHFDHFYVRSRADARKLRSITIDCELTLHPGPYADHAKMMDYAWVPPETKTTIGFVIAKLRQRYRRWVYGV